MKVYAVYILTNAINTVLYTGVTNDLAHRVWQHKNGQGSTFTSKYRVTKLVYFETFGDITMAIAREKQIKGGSRRKKAMLVESINPDWRDLSEQLRLGK